MRGRFRGGPIPPRLSSQAETCGPCRKLQTGVLGRGKRRPVGGEGQRPAALLGARTSGRSDGCHVRGGLCGRRFLRPGHQQQPDIRFSPLLLQLRRDRFHRGKWTVGRCGTTASPLHRRGPGGFHPHPFARRQGDADRRGRAAIPEPSTTFRPRASPTSTSWWRPTRTQTTSGAWWTCSRLFRCPRWSRTEYRPPPTSYEHFLDAIANANAAYTEAKRGDRLTLGSLTFDVLSPEERRSGRLGQRVPRPPAGVRQGGVPLHGGRG